MPRRRNATIQLEALQRLSRAKLRTLWTEELSETPTSSLGRDILALGIAYARQERLYGGLSRRVVKELERLGACALSNGAEAELSSNPIPRAGTILVREWHGVTHHASRRYFELVLLHGPIEDRWQYPAVIKVHDCPSCEPVREHKANRERVGQPHRRLRRRRSRRPSRA
jgi:hypothetical protein